MAYKDMKGENDQVITLKTEVKVTESIDSLKYDYEKELCQKASNAINTSYAPYSKYRVGAAVLLENGKIISGANQENAVFPLGLCAERVAIFSSLSQYPDAAIKAIAIKTEKKLLEEEFPGFPCGSCRQTMVEMEQRFSKIMKVFILGENEKVYQLASAKDLLPFAFDQNAL